MSSTGAGHWSEISNRWALVGAPLRPSTQDIQTFQQIISREPEVKGLILGVTPELYRLNWPEASDLFAVDNNSRMVETVWAGPRNQVILGDWRSLPLQNESRTVAFCDGGFHLLSNPVGQLEFINSIKKVLTVGGVCAIRLFALPDKYESEDSVLTELLAGQIDSLNILKLRLGMAMQKTSSEGVRLGDIWERISTLKANFEELSDQIGWPLEHLRAIDSYRGSDARYCFVTPMQVQDMFCKLVGGFQFESAIYPDYPLGERCPIVIFRKVA